MTEKDRTVLAGAGIGLNVIMGVLQDFEWVPRWAQVITRIVGLALIVPFAKEYLLGRRKLRERAELAPLDSTQSVRQQQLAGTPPPDLRSETKPPPIRLMVIVNVVFGFMLFGMLGLYTCGVNDAECTRRVNQGMGAGLGIYTAGVFLAFALAKRRRNALYWWFWVFAFLLGVWIGGDLTYVGRVEWPPFGSW